MNSTRLRISENAKNIGSQVVSKSEELLDLLAKVETTNLEVSQAWAGQDSTDYTRRIEEQCAEIKKLFETAVATGNALESAAQAYADAKTTNSTYGS